MAILISDNRSAEWKVKADTYRESGVWEWFKRVRDDSSRATGLSGLAHKHAQAIVDKFLEDKRSGKAVVIPDEVDADMVGTGLVSKERFAAAGNIDEVELVRWVFNNLWTEVTAEDAPSAGAFNLLRELRENTTLRGDFIKGIWAKILPTRSELDKRKRFEDDGREQFALLERLTKEASVSKES